jgi:hypothetical protein
VAAKEKSTVHSFTLVLQGVAEVTDRVEDALFEAGCDDALLASRNGVVFLEFDRKAPSFQEAVRTAVGDVHKAGIGATVARVEPDEELPKRPVSRRDNELSTSDVVRAFNAVLELRRVAGDEAKTPQLFQEVFDCLSPPSSGEGTPRPSKRTAKPGERGQGLRRQSTPVT